MVDAVGTGLFLCQQVLLLQSLEVGKPLSVLSLAPLPAIVDRTTSIIGKTGRSDWLNDKPGRKKEQCCDAPNQNNRRASGGSFCWPQLRIGLDNSAVKLMYSFNVLFHKLMYSFKCIEKILPAALVGLASRSKRLSSKALCTE